MIPERLERLIWRLHDGQERAQLRSELLELLSNGIKGRCLTCRYFDAEEPYETAWAPQYRCTAVPVGVAPILTSPSGYCDDYLAREDRRA